MTSARTPVLPKATVVGALSAQLGPSWPRPVMFAIVDHKTLDQLTALSSPGESYSDVILRLAKG